MLQPYRNYSVGNEYRYGFNGKEEDDEVSGNGNQYDYGDRIYNARVGRFLSVDPLQADYPELTPYQFASNTPIQGVDLDGREIYHYLLLKGNDGKPYLKYQGEQIREFGWWEIYDKASPATRYMNAQGSKITTKTISVWLNPEPVQPFNEIWGRTREFSSFRELYDWEAAGFPEKPVDPAEVEEQRKAGEELAQQATLQLMMMTLENQIDMADGDIDGYAEPSILPGKESKGSPSTSTNKQATAANRGNTQAATANNAAKNTTANTGKSVGKGVVYERIDQTSELKPYVGQAKSMKRYVERQKEHARENPNAKFKFKIIDRGAPGKDLNKKEQKALDARGGPTNKSNPNGGTSNKKNVIKKLRA